MQLTELGLKGLRTITTKILGYPKNRSIDCARVEYFTNEANEYIYNRIYDSCDKSTGLAICKFGTIELGTMVSYKLQNNIHFTDYIKFLRGYPIPLFYKNEIVRVHNNAGIFPATKEVVDKFVSMMFECLPNVDILSSYCYAERYIEDDIKKCNKIDLEGFYAPFLFENPWTRILQGKKVLVIHPFAESIKSQYEKRDLLFDNPNVLPEFKSLHVIKAVQSIAGQKCEYDNWFEALESMKKQMEEVDFDIAIIGCGAYGFPLTVHAKCLGKVGVHLAGWTQMLFGIYGKRWIEDQPEYVKFINKNWIRPSQNEVPRNASSVEGACYW